MFVEHHFEERDISQLQQAVERRTKAFPSPFSLHDYCYTIPLVVREVIADALQKARPQHPIITHWSHAWIRDHLQLSSSVDQFLSDLCARISAFPSVSFLSRLQEDPLVRIKLLAHECVQTPFRELLGIDQALQILPIVTKTLVRLACERVTVIHHHVPHAIPFKPSAVECVYEHLRQRIERGPKNPMLTVGNLIRLVEEGIEEEIAIACKSLASDTTATAFLNSLPLDDFLGAVDISIRPRDIHCHLFIALTEHHPVYRDLLLHFGDSNYGTVLSNAFSAVHYCLWFDPLDDIWAVATVPETGQWVTGIKVDEMKIGDISLIESPLHTFSERYRKERLEQDRTISRTIQQLDRAFADALAVYRHHFGELVLEAQLRLFRKKEPLIPVNADQAGRLIFARSILAAEKPQDQSSALLRCHEIVSAYAHLRGTDRKPSRIAERTSGILSL